MQGQKVLFAGGQGPVSAPAARSLATDNHVFAMARFSNPEARRKLEECGITCIKHDLLEPFDDIPTDFDYVYHTAMPMSLVFEPLGRWPDSYDKYADATGRLMAHLPGVKGFLFASTSSVYDPPGGSTAVPETHSFGIHTSAAYAFTKVANEQVVSYLSRSLNIRSTIIRVANASGVDGGPMRDRLDLIVQGKPIPLHIDKPNYVRPIFEPDAARLGVAALKGGRIPPLVVNWCGDDLTSIEEYCSFMAALIGREAVFEYVSGAWPPLVLDTKFRNEVLGPCEVRWQDGCRMLVEQCYPDLVK
jgi:UDP-glucuronate 4-epimerase